MISTSAPWYETFDTAILSKVSSVGFSSSVVAKTFAASESLRPLPAAAMARTRRMYFVRGLRSLKASAVADVLISG